MEQNKENMKKTINDLKVGDYVKITTTGDIGDILGIDIEENEVHVSIPTDGDVRFLSFSEIEPLS